VRVRGEGGGGVPQPRGRTRHSAAPLRRCSAAARDNRIPSVLPRSPDHSAPAGSTNEKDGEGGDGKGDQGANPGFPYSKGQEQAKPDEELYGRLDRMEMPRWVMVAALRVWLVQLWLACMFDRAG